jgi:hypothetical protein
MKNYEKISIFVFMLLFDFIAFAQPGDTDGTPGGLESDEPAAPINGKLFILALIGIMFMFYKLKNTRKQLS